MFTVLFALARTVGWIAQWKEMVEDPSQRIGRPRQLYTGAPSRDYMPIDSAANLSVAPQILEKGSLGSLFTFSHH
nr:citrate/2-methylcitrate synthase [Pseudovibrio sp. M1P-2-3]